MVPGVALLWNLNRSWFGALRVHANVLESGVPCRRRFSFVAVNEGTR